MLYNLSFGKFYSLYSYSGRCLALLVFSVGCDCSLVVQVFEYMCSYFLPVRVFLFLIHSLCGQVMKVGGSGCFSSPDNV